VLFAVGFGASAFACFIFSASQIAYRQSICPELRGRMNAASRWIIYCGLRPCKSSFRHCGE
jgi:hypothetical protein